MNKFNKLYNEYIDKPVLTFENKELLLTINREDFLQILKYGKDLEIVLKKIKEIMDEDDSADNIYMKLRDYLEEII